MNRQPLDWEGLGRYLAGEASPDEAEAMRRWLDDHPSDAKFVAALNDATKHMAAESRIDVEAALRKVKTRARAKSPWRFGAYAAAAAVLLIAGVTIARRQSDVYVVVGRQYSTAVGQRDSTTLPDGTRVLLGPASRISVVGRQVQLEGEAFFSVAHDPAVPFTVIARDVTIRDIGTAFSVHSDSAEAVRVVVSEGVVLVLNQRDSVTLKAGDVGTVDSSGRVEASRGAATADDLAWTQGRLVFRDAPVSELASDLRRWYGVELRVAPADTALLRRHFTGSFVSETPDRVLDIIALALGGRVEQRGDTAYLRRR